MTDLTTRRHNWSAQPDINTADLLFREVRPADAAVLVAQLERLPGANRVSIFASGLWSKGDFTDYDTSILFAHDTPVYITARYSDSGTVEHEGDLYLPAPDATADPSYSECPHLTIAFSQEGA
jgi:hypothetical protein